MVLLFFLFWAQLVKAQFSYFKVSVNFNCYLFTAIKEGLPQNCGVILLQISFLETSNLVKNLRLTVNT